MPDSGTGASRAPGGERVSKSLRQAARAHLAVALDLSTLETLRSAAHTLAPAAGIMKIGLEAFVSFGPALVEELRRAGNRIFLDLKLHDIPNTVGGAAAAAARSGASILTLHAWGGPEMLRIGAERAREAASAAGLPPPRILGVTVLTSLDERGLVQLGLSGPTSETVKRLALLALGAGLDGVVCSPQELTMVRAACGSGFFLAVPGIRPAGSGPDDQKRTATPAAAIRAGADLLVVGRPITRAPDPLAAAEAVLLEIAFAL